MARRYDISPPPNPPDPHPFLSMLPLRRTTVTRRPVNFIHRKENTSVSVKLERPSGNARLLSAVRCCCFRCKMACRRALRALKSRVEKDKRR